jgi:hypothetical protein
MSDFMSRSSDRLRSPGEGRDRRGPRHQETTLPSASCSRRTASTSTCPDAAPVTTDGPLPETSDLVAGWYMIDVESHERAVELAAYVSAEPGPGGDPLHEWIDVREVISEAPSGG